MPVRYDRKLLMAISISNYINKQSITWSTSYKATHALATNPTTTMGSLNNKSSNVHQIANLLGTWVEWPPLLSPVVWWLQCDKVGHDSHQITDHHAKYIKPFQTTTGDPHLAQHFVCHHVKRHMSPLNCCSNLFSLLQWSTVPICESHPATLGWSGKALRAKSN